MVVLGYSSIWRDNCSHALEWLVCSNFCGGVLAVIYLGATAGAPIRQRNEARRLVLSLTTKSTAQVAERILREASECGLCLRLNTSRTSEQCEAFRCNVEKLLGQVSGNYAQSEMRRYIEEQGCSFYDSSENLLPQISSLLKRRADQLKMSPGEIVADFKAGDWESVFPLKDQEISS